MFSYRKFKYNIVKVIVSEFYWFYFCIQGEKMKKMNLILLILGLFASSVALANAPEQIKTAQTSPVELIQSTIVKLNQLTTITTRSPEMLNILVEKEITPLFDFNHIAREVLWVLNANLSAAQVRNFADKLKQDIISTLLFKLSQMNSTSLNFVSARPIIGNGIAVKLRADNYAPFGFYVDLLFHQNEYRKWQIFDIILNNDSLINYYQKRVLIQAKRHGIYKVLDKFN